MIKGKDIIVVSQQAWDIEIGFNAKDIALEFSRNNRVLYVNAALDRITKYRGKNDGKVQKRVQVIKGNKEGLIKINENLFCLYPDVLVESINWIASTYIFDKLNYVNNQRFANSIKRAIEKLGFRDFLIFNDNDIFRSYFLKELLQPQLSAYYLRDNFLGVSYWRRHGTLLEPRLIKKSDLCLTNSEYFRDHCLQYNPNSFFVGQGCDFSLYTIDGPFEKPPEFENVPKPVIGYVGALWTSRLDLPLLETLAQKNEQWSFVYVGPEDEEFKNSLLHNLPNVFFFGSVKPERLPAYINSFDVCLNPQYINPITKWNYPRKIDEYLALGKPTVATGTEFMRFFKDYVYLVNGSEEYESAIKLALEENTPLLEEKRRLFALEHTWENSVKAIYTAFEEVADKKGIRLQS